MPTRLRRRLLTAITWTIAGFAGGLLAVITIPTLFGYHAYVVRSGSMEPQIHTGDVVVDRTIPPLDARVGDTVTFRDPNNPHRLITHRIRAITVRSAHARFTTIGLANTTPEHWNVSTSGHIGRVEYRIPKLGWLLAIADAPGGKLILVIVPILALTTLALLTIWQPPPQSTRRRSAAPQPAT
jgi:signal peptidase